MAAIERVADGKDIEQILNVDSKVGDGKTNLWSDIIVVQALLLYYKEYDDFAPGKTVTPSNRPDGQRSSGLYQMIKLFQKHQNKYFNQRLTEDGVISKAKGTSEWRPGKRWTIYQLNSGCATACSMRSLGKNNDHIADIRKKYYEVEWALVAVPLPF